MKMVNVTALKTFAAGAGWGFSLGALAVLMLLLKYTNDTESENQFKETFK